jgi:hypothetical protein
VRSGRSTNLSTRQESRAGGKMAAQSGFRKIRASGEVREMWRTGR